MRANQQRERIELGGGRALGVMALVPYLLGASAFATPVWYLAVLPNIGFDTVNATAREAAYVYDVPAVTTITVPRDQLEDAGSARPPAPSAPSDLRPLGPTSITVQ